MTCSWLCLYLAQLTHSPIHSIFSILIVASSFYVITDIVFFGNVVPLVNRFLEWMAMHTVWAVIACVFFFAAATLVFVPHAILTCGAGWAFSNVLGFGFGLVIALFVSFMGSALGAVLAFIRSRYMMRDLVELFAERFPIVKAVDRALERKGFKVRKEPLERRIGKRTNDDS